MNPQLESVQYPQRSIILLGDAFNFEYIFWTDALTIALAFAAFQIDHRIDDAGRPFAGWRRSAQVRPSLRPQRAA
jgi:hypothetical protein